MRDIFVERLSGISAAERSIEIVERKGLGHPDTICDSIMERVAVALSKEYVERFGTVLHHNIDKGLLVAGGVERRFRGGRVTEPMKLIFGDRAVSRFGNETIPVGDIAVTTAKQWFRENLRFVDPEQHVEYQVEIRETSQELKDIFSRGEGVFAANDTSAAVGYAPLTETERIVLETEMYLNSNGFKESFPETGEDIKVMGFRRERGLALTIAMPLIDKYIMDESEYFFRKEIIYKAIEELLFDKCNNFDKVDIYLNTLDRKGRGLDGIYLSVTGTSAENADSGEVGRGNRVNGIISLGRPSSAEAAAGKNAVSHIGKIYNVMTHKMAHAVYEGVVGIKEIYVWLAGRIGSPVDEPAVISAQVLLEHNASFASVSKKIKEMLEREMSKTDVFCDELRHGKYPIC